MSDEAPAITSKFSIRQVNFDAKAIEPGLYLVATPIGNLADITIRALDVLASCDILACEDTRMTRKLLDRYGIAQKTFAYHEHNAEFAGTKLLAALDHGKSVALVSDAGTPLISDPGYRITQSAIEAGHTIIPIPGASAPMAGLMGAGLPTDSFFFGGFLPHKTKAKRDRLSALKDIPASLVFFDSPHRITDTLSIAADMLGFERRASVCRELTKAHEEFARGTLGDLANAFNARHIKGEIVLIIGPPDADKPPMLEDIDGLLHKLAEDMGTGQAASEAAKQTGLPRKMLYQKLLELKNDGS